MIQERLSGRKILLALDDVNDIEQLRNLAGAHWFGVGKILDNHKALELFSWHAFKTNEPLDDYAELAERAIRYAQGLPLALTVLGSCLYGGSKDKWQAALHGFKSAKIQEVLKISYNALDDIVKEVFLDIACFFKGKSRNYAIETLEACDLNPRYGIEVLIEKALISVEESYIQMHDLLEEMGKEIAHQESPTEPGERSRLWFHKDVDHVLTNSTGTNKITRIMLNFPDPDDDEIYFNIDSFSEMKNLKLFINYNAFLYGDVGHLPNKLKVLRWYGCPYQSFLPNFRSKELVVLNLPRNRLKQPGERLKHFTKLTSLNLSVSVFLTEIPDLSSIPNLKYLYALYCSSLVEVHPSVGYLGKLEVLDLTGCPRLAKFPKKIRWKSLKRFLLSFCKMFESFPEVVDKMEFICELNLDGTAIKELPSSIGHLTGLTTLSLCFTPLKELPSSIGYLTRLEYLALQGCRNVTNLPQSIYGLQHLEVLDLNSCSKLTLNLNSEVLSSAESLPFGVLSNSNISHDNFGSLAFPELQYVYFEECNLLDIDFLENFGSSSELHQMVLCEIGFMCCFRKLLWWLWLSSRKIESAHVWLLYIPLADYYIEPNVNDKESADQLKKSYMCRVTFSYGGEGCSSKAAGLTWLISVCRRMVMMAKMMKMN